MDQDRRLQALIYEKKLNMSRQLALINGQTLRLLRESKRVSHEYLEKKCGPSASLIQLWEEDLGEDYPTMRQAEKLAETLQVPLAGLYLEPNNLPVRALPNSTNMRRFENGRFPDDSSLNLAIDWLLSLREEIIEIRDELSIPNIRTSFPALDKDPQTAAYQLRNYFGFTFEEQRKSKSRRQLFLLLRKLIESKGVLLAQYNGVELETARGISVYFDIIPIIGVNITDHAPAMSFTAIHELVHLTQRASTVCNQMGTNTISKEEVFCNAVAGEFLVPRADLIRILKDDDPLSLEVTEKIASMFSVSRDVISRRFYDLGFIDKRQYESMLEFYDSEAKAKREEERLKRETGIESSFFGLSAEKKVADKFGSVYCESILRGIENGLYSEYDAGKKLNINEGKLRDVFREALK